LRVDADQDGDVALTASGEEIKRCGREDVGFDHRVRAGRQVTFQDRGGGKFAQGCERRRAERFGEGLAVAFGVGEEIARRELDGFEEAAALTDGAVEQTFRAG